MIFGYHFLGFFYFFPKVILCCPAYRTCPVAGPVFPDVCPVASPVFLDVSGTHTGRVRYQVRYCWQYSVQQPFLPRFVHLSSVLRSIYCVGFLLFHRPYLGALVTGWFEYPRFKTLLLFYRSKVSWFLVFWFGTLYIFGPFALWWSAVF
jgi:hypothetical protein